MAIVLPLLLFILMAMIDFGRAYNAQIQLSQAAREGVRLASLHTSGDYSISADPFGSAAIPARAQTAAAGVSGVTAAVTTPCPQGDSTTAAVVTVNAPFTWITGISGMSNFFGGGFATPTTIQTTGVMRCSG